MTLAPAPAPRTKRKRSAAPNPEAELIARLSRAAVLKAQIDSLEAELGDLRSWLLAHLESTGRPSAGIDGFAAYRRVRHRWSYSCDLAREMLAVQQAQKWEQQQGIAHDAPTSYVALCFKGGEAS